MTFDDWVKQQGLTEAELANSLPQFRACWEAATAAERERWEPSGPICGRCCDEVEVFPANCDEKPELWVNAPLGMYHCPDCGAMLLAGLLHPPLCQRCLDRTHPAYDPPAAE